MITTDELANRAEVLREMLRCCTLCPQRCGVNRLAGELGRCRTGAQARVASNCAHNGEEPCLSGERGAGTIFLAGCNLQCVYCQNHQISQGDISAYPEVSDEQLADIMLNLLEIGCLNLDWVSPTHVVPQLVGALALARGKGLTLPVVYNSNGYEELATLQLLEGIVDIYLPDLKYADAAAATRYSAAPGYPDIALRAIREMYRQVGALAVNDAGVATRGVIVRHLVLPHDIAGSRVALRRLAEEISPEITVSLMAQYYPSHRALEYPELARQITAAEYEAALDAFTDAGLENGWAQDVADAPDCYQPDFTRETPFEREKLL